MVNSMMSSGPSIIGKNSELPEAGLSPGQLAATACLLEVTARKPGNVHRAADFADSHYVDFLLSAVALVEPMDRAAETGVGRTVLASVRATQTVVATNTNLGMILLFAPLAALRPGEDAQLGVQRVLADTNLEDCRLVYEAIRLANPGGLGSASEQDIAAEPTVSLIDAMRLAADRDLIAAQFANHYRDVFESVFVPLEAAIDAGNNLETAIVFAHLSLMAARPDTLIARKRGRAEAEEVSRRAKAVLALGWPDEVAAGRETRQLDHWLRAEGHARNPGTTADLVAAGLFLALRDGTIAMPLKQGSFIREPRELTEID
jgi:triphosphoribosyl-dephospho-CoA synthase